ncbi:restriction endonuclease [Actinoplanes philippinensis]|uniref:Restriction system protein n=2 Tax=Actinoplanes philippinensis TaxID=35752 RepID=A0A1I2C330_9ACTN|nr:restriction endonuclease [Actinoplanes philippinensis]SFE62694.1 restriction system protein [Actinoplanes philippinensis]
MLPVLRSVADGKEHRIADLRNVLAETLGLTEEDLGLKIRSGAPVFNSRVHWAVTYLSQAGVLRRPRRGMVELTDRGRDLLVQAPPSVDNGLLARYPEFREFMVRARLTRQDSSETEVPTEQLAPGKGTPKEQLANAVEEANAAIAADLINRIQEREPAFLEHLVLKLLTAMGYGGKAGAAEHLGQTGDHGLDGVIRQDVLGLDRVYVQAKRYGSGHSIGRPDIQAFVGALHGAQADRGIFITTSRFTTEAKDYAERVPARLVLIDGARLAELMVLHNVEVQEEQTFILKRAADASTCRAPTCSAPGSTKTSSSRRQTTARVRSASGHA